MKINQKLALILCAALILRIINLGQSLWLDEATTALVARDYSWTDFFSWFIRADFHPPLYYALIKLTASLFGNYSEVFLRVPSLVAGVITVYLVYKQGGKLPALLLATAPLHIYYSQEARMYMLACLLVTLAVYFHTSQKPLAFMISYALALWTDYVVIFMLPVFLISGNKFKHTLGSLILCMPMLLFLPSQLSIGSGVSSNWAASLGYTNLKNALLIPVKFMIGRVGFQNGLLYGFIVVLFGLIAIYLLFRSYKKSNITWYWLIFPVILGLAVGLFIPIVSYFRFLFVLPAFYLLLGNSKSRLVYAILVLNVIFSVYYLFSPQFHREDWRGLVSFIESSSSNNYKVIFPADSQMEAYKYYSKQSKFSGPSGISENLDEIWLMRYVYDIVDPADTARIKIENLGFEKVAGYDFNRLIVYKYENSN